MTLNLPLPSIIIACLNDSALSDEHLVDVEEDVAALDDHPLDGQVLPDVLSVRDLKSRITL